MGVGVFLEGQGLGSEADHSPPLIAEINNSGAYYLHGLQRDNHTLNPYKL